MSLVSFRGPKRFDFKRPVPHSGLGHAGFHWRIDAGDTAFQGMKARYDTGSAAEGNRGIDLTTSNDLMASALGPDGARVPRSICQQFFTSAAETA